MRKRSHLRGPSEAVTWLEWRKNRAGGLAKPIAANLHRLQQLSRAERRSKRGSLAAREASGTPKYGLRWASAMGSARGRVNSRTEVAVGPSKGMGQSNVCHPHVGMCLEQSRKKCGSKGSIRPYIHSLDSGRLGGLERQSDQKPKARARAFLHRTMLQLRRS